MEKGDARENNSENSWLWENGSAKSILTLRAKDNLGERFETFHCQHGITAKIKSVFACLLAYLRDDETFHFFAPR